jgi:four helix bundle protein
MVDKIESFEQLNVWKSSINLAADIYKLTGKFPTSEQFGITNQMRRAATSISANIAEGFGRQGQKEKLQFYSIAYGSLLETKSFIYLAQKLNYITTEELDTFIEQMTLLQKQINALTKTIRNA